MTTASQEVQQEQQRQRPQQQQKQNQEPQTCIAKIRKAWPFSRKPGEPLPHGSRCLANKKFNNQKQQTAAVRIGVWAP